MDKDWYLTLSRYFTKSSPLPTYFTVPDRSLFIIPKFIPYSMGAGEPKNYSYATAVNPKIQLFRISRYYWSFKSDNDFNKHINDFVSSSLKSVSLKLVVFAKS